MRKVGETIPVVPSGIEFMLHRAPSSASVMLTSSLTPVMFRPNNNGIEIRGTSPPFIGMGTFSQGVGLNYFIEGLQVDQNGPAGGVGGVERQTGTQLGSIVDDRSVLALVCQLRCGVDISQSREPLELRIGDRRVGRRCSRRRLRAVRRGAKIGLLLSTGESQHHDYHQPEPARQQAGRQAWNKQASNPWPVATSSTPRRRLHS